MKEQKIRITKDRQQKRTLNKNNKKREQKRRENKITRR